jgi:hypothetical protein
MPRPPEVPGKPATENLNTKVHAEMMAYVDSVRGTRSRGGFVRDLIRDHKKRSKR